MTKKCSKCRQIKETIDFCKDQRSKDELQSQCKKCKSESVTKYHKTEAGKAYRKENRRKWEIKYAKKYPEKLRKKSLKSYYRNRVARNISKQIRNSLRSDKKGVSWEEVVGYTIDELKEHLESKFQPGMTWDNYGQWHIDHIIPVASFEIKSIDSQAFRDCWALSNLQPLWAKDNLSKGSKTAM